MWPDEAACIKAVSPSYESWVDENSMKQYMVRMIDISSCNQKALHNLLLTISGSPDQWEHCQQFNNIIAFCFCGQFQCTLFELFEISRFHSMRQYLVRIVDIGSCTQEHLDNLNVTLDGSKKQSCSSKLPCVSRLHSMGNTLLTWFTSAPAVRRKLTISMWPMPAAQNKAVLPSCHV